MNSNMKYALGAVGLFMAGGIFATAILSTMKPAQTQATLKDDTYKYAGVTTEATSSQQQTQNTGEQTTASADKEQSGYYVTAAVKGTPWSEGNLTIQEIEFTINNKGNDTITDWTGAIDLNTPVEGINSWNDTFTYNASTVSIKPIEWNKEIKPGESKTLNFHLKTSLPAQVTKASVSSNLGSFDSGKPAPVQQSEPVLPDDANGETPVAKHGRLSVKGTKIVDKNGDAVLLQGVSTHGISWFPAYVNKEAFRTLRDTMGVNTVRLALYSSTGEGYSTAMHQKVIDGVNYAKELGMYAIVDWHILANGNPNTDKEAAKAFFTEMTGKFKDYDNVIYEICNEPNGNVSWDNDIKPYAEEMIDLIRKTDDKAIIIVGTPTWSQDVDIAAKNPITGRSNIMYALHFYAATHRADLRNKLSTAIGAGLPVFVSEFGISEASGSGGIDEGEATTWINYLRQNGIGYVCWNLSNKDEACALIKSSSGKVSGWTDEDLTQEGLWLKKTYTN